MSAAMMLWCSARTKVRQDASSSSLYCFILAHTCRQTGEGGGGQPWLSSTTPTGEVIATSLPNLEKRARQASLPGSVCRDATPPRSTPC